MPVAKADGGGLYFTLSTAGTATWILRYRSQNKRRELTLGNYPDIKLADARKLSGKHRAEVDEGVDPATVKATRKREEATPKWTIKTLAADYQAKQLTPGSFAAVTLYYRNADLKRVIIPKLGNRQVEGITGTSRFLLFRIFTG